MSEPFAPPRAPRRDGGFTIVEILITVVLTGILMTTLAGTLTVMLRTTPASQQRLADARSLKGLVTWLPQDMDAAPPDGFNIVASDWSCAGPAPTDSHNVVGLTWVEDGTSVNNFHTSYRYERSGSVWKIARYRCQNGGAASSVNMTSELPPWNATTPPAWVDMCSTALDPVTGVCPSGSEATDPTVEPVESLNMTLTLLDGSLYTIDAAAKNPDEDLKDDPDAVTNLPPTAGSSNHDLTIVAGATEVLDLYATHGISDPEADELTSARDSFEPMPAGITVTSSDPLLVTVEADPSLTAGVLADPIPLIVSDAFGGSLEVTVTVEIVEPPNDPPVAAIGPSYTLTIGQGETVILPLDITHGIFDPNDDDMSLEVWSWPAPLANKPDVQWDDPTLDDLEVSITAKASAALGPVVTPVDMRIYDEHSAFIHVEIFLNIVGPSANNPPTVTSTDVPITMSAGDTAPPMSVDMSHGAFDPDSDLIWVEIDPAAAPPAGLTVTTTWLGVTIEADSSMVSGVAGAVPLLVHDWHGATAAITVTVEIVPPPPPPSDCVLGTLSVDVNPVNRQGSGGGPRALADDVLVTVDYTGSCDGLVLKYDTGHPSGLGGGVGRVFPAGSPTTVVLVGYDSGGTEKWTAGNHVLTASTTSAVTPNSVAITLTVN